MNVATSLLIIAPPEVQTFAAPLRQKYALDSFMQGPAHITLFFPFVPYDEIVPAANRLTELCKDVSPFQITLEQYDRFETAHFLAPSDPEPILSLHRYLLAAFPQYLPYEGEHGAELIPHLTLAHMETKQEADNIKLPPCPRFSFVVDQLCLYIGPEEGNIPWIPRAIFPLGG
jgi:2'-5' RNA ligase